MCIFLSMMRHWHHLTLHSNMEAYSRSLIPNIKQQSKIVCLNNIFDYYCIITLHPFLACIRRMDQKTIFMQSHKISHISRSQYCILFYLNVSDELLRRRLNGCLVLNDTLNSWNPSHGLVQQLGVEPVGMFPPVNHNVPISYSVAQCTSATRTMLTHRVSVIIYRVNKLLWASIWVTCLFEHLLVRLNHRAEAVQHQRAHLGCAALSRFVVVQRVVGQNEPALLQFQRTALGSWLSLHLFMQPAWFTKKAQLYTIIQWFSGISVVAQHVTGLTSNQELLTFDLGVSFGLLQEADPVVHLLRQIRVTVDHSIRRNDHKWVRSVG